jgi:hypothetical protein
MINKKFMGRAINRKEIIEFSLFILGVLGIIIFKISDNKKNEDIFSDQGYVVGTVEQYESGQAYVGWVPNSYQLTIRSPTITFTYKINKIQYSQNYASETFHVPVDGIKKGEKYIVVYNINKPKEARMLFDFPILDSTDFKKYVQEFKANPPNLEQLRKKKNEK